MRTYKKIKDKENIDITNINNLNESQENDYLKKMIDQGIEDIRLGKTMSITEAKEKLL